jgi:hypothetical protein
MCPVQFNTTDQPGLKLGLFTSVDNEGRTIILAASLLMHEDTESFQRVFAQFKAAFGVSPDFTKLKRYL